MAHVRRLAKLTRPRLHRTVPREHLFDLLDDAGHTPIVWLEGPPGSGKTTTVAAYLEARDLRALWCRLDRADADPSSFFHYLSEGLAVLVPRAARRLPSFGPEYQSDPVTFAHRFFRALFEQLPRDALVVLDDYHELPAGSETHRIFEAAAAEIPDGVRIVVASRAPPPGELSRCELSGSIARFNWSVLRLSARETRAIAASRGYPLDAAAAQTLHASSDGWVAAVCLWLDGNAAAGPAATPLRADDREPLFRYLAAEVLARESAASRDVMLATCLLPAFTVDEAVRLSDGDAGCLVQDHFRRQLFIERCADSDVMYRYHDLFRSFLQTVLQESQGMAGLIPAARRSGQVLLDSDRLEEAYPLLAQGEDWDAAEAVFVRLAPALIGQGRWKTLERWSAMLPANRVDRNPWLLYWRGRSVTLLEPGTAQQLLVRACDLFEECHDRRGEALAVAGVLDALHFDVRAFDRLPLWLMRLIRRVREGLPDMPVEDALQVHAAVLVSSSHLALPGPDLDAAVGQVTALLGRCTDANLVLSVANMVHYYAGHCLDAFAHEAAALAARAMIEDANLSADRLALYWLAEGHAHYSFARFRTALECFDRADRVIAANDLGRRRLVAGTWRCQCLAMSGEVRESEAVASSLQPLASGLPSFVEALYRWAVGIVEHQAGQLDQSIESGATAVALNRRSGSPISAALWLPRLCVRLMEVGRTGAAIELLGDPALTENSVAYSRHRAGLTLIHAWAALSNGDRDAAATALRDALSCARDARERIRLRWFVPALVELLPFGLEQGIAPDVIGSLVSAFGIDPPSDGFEPWPWPVRIATLGRFEVSVNGTPLVFGRKMPRRTLALLVALVAAGGRHVSESRLSDALWPDLDGDAAHESFASALHRLRRLLGGNDRILQTGRTLSLNSSRCFVDTWALELALRSPDGIARTLALYRGPFMPEDDAPGTVAHRQSLRARVARAVQIRATDLRSTGLHEAAEALLNRIADADPALFDRYPPHDGHVQCDP